jgi:ABC-type Fe3+-citrate transport system substrate-binding protein
VNAPSQFGAAIVNTIATSVCMEIRCNIYDEVINSSTVVMHVACKNHGVKKKVDEFNEMNAQVKSPFEHDTSVVEAWIKELYHHDFLSTGRV